MIEIKARIQEIPGADAVSMELIWNKEGDPTPAEKKFAVGVIDLLTGGPNGDAFKRLGGFEVHKPKDN